MNSVVFGLLLVVCAFEVSHADLISVVRNNIQQAANKLDSISNDLSRTSKNLQFNTQMQISNKKTDYMSQVNGFVNPALSQIRIDVDAAKAEGKDAEHCYNTARESLRTVSLNGFSALDSCDSVAKETLRQATSGLGAQESTAQYLKSQVNNILLSCYSSNQMQMANCATMKLAALQIEIRSLESNVNSAKLTASSEANKAVLSITTCGMNAMNPVRIGTTDAKIAASNCVKNA